MSVNGNLYDWESVEVQLPNGVAVGITSINYNDERPIEARYGKGNVPRGYGRKNYKASGSMELDRDEAEALREALGGSVYSGEPFQIVVSYGNNDMPTVTDTLPKVKITKQDSGASQDDDNAGAVKYDLNIIAPIKWGGTPAL
ncbi:hypothetical protein [Pseudodesulfovibrio indicus]|uniref:Phage tail protein n=1 Tax=Pseudodesulfovibrio indicus TaxID=1716143 RepID=A0A126QLS3_9BACT|nr:hypothetical protein [Pseudodesulfovibrio indicus]AMK10851.1 hypothetical protein AWY79_06895 [Pseudodesulfovibrio indicus]TDT91844.1 hypothetical protein EDC59_101247 [Pseudodesulfovibrio indicus]